MLGSVNYLCSIPEIARRVAKLWKTKYDHKRTNVNIYSVNGKTVIRFNRMGSVRHPKTRNLLK